MARVIRPRHQPHPTAPVDEKGLIVDSSDNERAETPSLHLNPGRGRRRGGKRKSKMGASGKHRRITLFGFDLFGRPPIQLPDDDADADVAPLFRRHSSGTPTTTLTTQTFDSDAAPLDISTIQSISVSKASEAAEAELKRLKEKEERRQRRKARKEMKRLVEAGVVGNGEEFEGFQESGELALLKRLSGVGGLRLRLRRGLIPGLTLNPSNRGKGFGHFVSAPPPTAAAEDDDEDVDLDGSLYARKKSKSTSSTRRNLRFTS